jgi:hypothetical protein
MVAGAVVGAIVGIAVLLGGGACWFWVAMRRRGVTGSSASGEGQPFSSSPWSAAVRLLGGGKPLRGGGKSSFLERTPSGPYVHFLEEHSTTGAVTGATAAVVRGGSLRGSVLCERVCLWGG